MPPTTLADIRPRTFGTVRLTIRTGDTWSKRIWWKDNDPDTSYPPMDLTGAMPLVQIRRRSGANRGAVLTSVVVDTSALASDGLTVLHIAAAETAKLPPVELAWDFQWHLSGGGGGVWTPIGGPVTVHGDVTRVQN